MQLLGIDNIFFEVRDLNAAILLYQQLGFTLEFKIPKLPGALLKIGKEEPGLILQEAIFPSPSKLWIEITNARLFKTICENAQLTGELLETTTGYTYQMKDPWKNVLGFADYAKKPDLTRKNST
ncbi:MAG: hypothetical protein NTY13_04065 [Chlamydiae bacterium]|nr:hypothetical protein [Chlamydiota bacterium]